MVAERSNLDAVAPSPSHLTSGVGGQRTQQPPALQWTLTNARLALVLQLPCHLFGDLAISLLFC